MLVYGTSQREGGCGREMAEVGMLAITILVVMVAVFPFVVGLYHLIWPTQEPKSEWVKDAERHVGGGGI